MQKKAEMVEPEIRKIGKMIGRENVFRESEAQEEISQFQRNQIPGAGLISRVALASLCSQFTTN